MTTAERPPEAQDNASSFFPGDTEMHGLVNAHDWSRTPLGPIEGWPQSLKTVVDLMLASPRPAHIAWGRNLALLYNDGYIPILGAKHRESLGRPCARLFAEIWDEYRPIAEATLAGKPQFFVDRPVPLEGPGGLPMRWFTFSWTPLRDDAGRVAGFYCATTETTSRVLAEREREDANGKLRESAERQAFLLELNVRMRAEASPDGIVAAASRMLGEYLDASRIVCAEIDDAAGTASIRQGWTAAGIETIPGELKLADFGGPLLDDLRAGKTVRYDDVGSTHARGDLAALAAIGIKAGLSVPLIVAGRFVVNLNVHQDRPRVWTDAEVRLAEAVAGQIWIALRHARVEEALRESESALADELADTQTLRRISNALVEDDSPAGLYRQILDGARALMRADFASVQKFDPERNELVLLAHHGFAAESAKHWQRVGVDCHTSCALATAQGQQAIITDAEQSADLAGTEDLAQFRRSGIRSMQSTPLISRGGHLVGMVSTHWRDVHRPSERESRLFGVVARQAADLIERHAAEERLRNSEENYRLLFDSIDEGFCIIEMLFDTNGKPFDYRFLKTNPAFGRQTGLQDAIGRSMKEMAPEHEATGSKFTAASR
jgi:GAF domain-containing protein